MRMIESFARVALYIGLITLLIGWCGVFGVVIGDLFDDWRKRRKRR